MRPTMESVIESYTDLVFPYNYLTYGVILLGCVLVYYFSYRKNREPKKARWTYSTFERVYSVTFPNSKESYMVTDIVNADIDRPRLYYRYLDQDLPAYYERGYYTMILELPLGYGRQTRGLTPLTSN